jgi:hypothetical protein
MLNTDDDSVVEEENNRRRRRFFFLLMAMRQAAKKKRSYFRDLLDKEGRRRRARNLPLKSIPSPGEAPWAKVYNSNDDGSLITVTGFDFSGFNYLLGLFTPLFATHTPWHKVNGESDGFLYCRINQNERRGRKRKINPTACLGLVLAWYRFRGSEFILQGWFGFTGCHLNVWLRFGRRMLLKALVAHPEAMVRFPDDDTIKAYKLAIHARHKALVDVYCVADGLKLPFQSCDGLTDQSMYYNGWTHGHYITNLFVFGADGRIINCVMNVPGSVHDSTIANWGGTYTKLKEIYLRTKGVCCVDSAFSATTVPYLLKSVQEKEVHAIAKNKEELRKLLEATSLRQAAEWGMRAIQGSMPRLLDAIKYEENGERRIIMKLVPLLYNLRLNRVGLNQLRNVYVKEWSRDSNYFIMPEQNKKKTRK